MGHKVFGNLAKVRGIIYYTISPYEQKALAGIISNGIPNTLRRFRENFFVMVPPFLGAYIIYDQVEKEYHRRQLKNPADFENDV